MTLSHLCRERNHWTRTIPGGT
ncbi:hypothetical protein FOXYSP1_01563 [Fusarium oxysporum f. sp. phaseoli]